MAKKEVLRNEDGHKLTKNGSVDQRSVKALENLKKSSVYQNIMKAKEGVAEAKKQDTNYEDESEEEESDEELEFEIQAKPKPKPVEEVKEVKEVEEKMAKLKFIEEKNDIEERTKKWLEEHQEATRKEKAEMKRLADEEVRLLKEENKKLKGLGAYNDHLSRISHLARNVSIKF
jgi:hypothetical protein